MKAIVGKLSLKRPNSGMGRSRLAFPPHFAARICEQWGGYENLSAYPHISSSCNDSLRRRGNTPRLSPTAAQCAMSIGWRRRFLRLRTAADRPLLVVSVIVWIADCAHDGATDAKVHAAA